MGGQYMGNKKPHLVEDGGLTIMGDFSKIYPKIFLPNYFIYGIIPPFLT